MEDEIVTIAEFTFKHQAELARVVMEENEIQCRLLDGEQAAYSLGILIPVRLQVFKQDEQIAREILVREGLYSYEE